MSVELIAEGLTQQTVWTFLVQFLREASRVPFSHYEPPIRIEDLRAYATSDGLRELFTETELDDRSIAALVYRHGFDARDNRAWKEVGYLLDGRVSADVAKRIEQDARREITHFLLVRKRQLG